MAKTAKTNPQLHRVVQELREVSREAGGAIWRDVAERLERSRKNWTEPVSTTPMARAPYS